MAMISIRHTSLGVLSAIAIACGGCHSETPVEPETPEIPVIAEPDMVTLCLDVSFDVNSTRTRAENDPDYYEKPEGSCEQINSLRVIIVRDMNPEHTLGTIEANRLVATTAEGFPKYDNLRFKVIEEEKPKRIYLIANEKSIMSAPTGFSSASEFLDSYKVGAESIDLTKLAFWTVSLPSSGMTGDETIDGLFSYRDTENRLYQLPLVLTEFFDVKAKSETQSLDNIYYSNLFLTRAAAKASFYIDQTGASPVYDDVKITSIKLSGIGSEEYVFPHEAVYSSGKYPAGSNDILETTISSVDISKDDLEMYITDFETPYGNRSISYVIDGLDVPVVDKTSIGEERKIKEDPIYFPESILAEDQKYEVSVQLSTGVWLTAPLVTNILSIGGRDAIARNTHLKITMSFTPKNFNAEVRVVPYIGIELDPVFGSSALIKPPKPREEPTE